MKAIGASFSTGKITPIHDFRNGLIPNNVDRERIKDNVILIDNLHGRTIEQFTNDEMQKYIDQYNEKQKQKCRRIEVPYTEWHKSNGLYTQNAKTVEDIKFAYEAVLCYGNNEDLWNEYFNPLTSQERKQELYKEAIEYYDKTIKEIQNKYHHIRILYAVIHADEPNGSIHAHLTFQARAEYTRGLPCQVCISRALDQDGISKLENRSEAKEEGYQLSRLYKQVRHEIMNPELERLGYVVKEEEHGKKHIPSNIFTEKMTELDEREKQVQSQEHFNNELEQLEEIERRPAYDSSKVKRVEVKETIFSKPEEVVQMPVDVFDSLKASADIKKLKKETEEKIKAQNKVIEQAKESIRTGTDKQLEQENRELREKTEQQELRIRSLNQQLEKKDKMIIRLKDTIELIKGFIRNHSLTHKLTEYLKQFQEPEIERSR